MACLTAFFKSLLINILNVFLSMDCCDFHIAVLRLLAPLSLILHRERILCSVTIK